MVAIVSVETVLLVLLLVLVVGLLRSHAEVLRRLGPGTGPDQLPADAVPAPATAANRGHDVPAHPIAGATPAGDAVALDLGGPPGEPTLLAFLTGGCTTCAGFWETLGESRLPQNVGTVIVTHGADRESPSRIRRLAPAGVPVVMSSEAWHDYAVPGAPYFVLVDGTVRGEGSAASWPALASLVTDAIEDQRGTSGDQRGTSGDQRGTSGDQRGTSGDQRGSHIDEVFAAAGIGPEHPSLYPGGPGGRE